MMQEIISIGDKLELLQFITNENDSVNKRIYFSQLLDFVENDKAIISMPIEKGRVIPLAVGNKYTLCFYTKKGLYQCKAVITGRDKIQNIHILEIQFISELEKFQRRKYYRLECNLYIKFHIITDMEIAFKNQLLQNDFLNDIDKKICSDSLLTYQNIWNEGVITDISGGGARFITNIPIDISNPVLLDINLYDNVKHIIEVKIISSSKLINRSDFFEYRTQFKNISSEEREAIIKFIFEEDRRQRKRNKGLV